MRASEFARLVRGAKPGANGWWKALCPAHDDTEASLTFKDGDRRLMLKCHAACDESAILLALALERTALFNSNGHPASVSDGANRIVATYDYRDERGELLYQVVRFEPKGFSQRRPDGRGGWIWNMNGVEHVLYRLPELRGAPRVYVAEGEKDVDNLRALGLVATTNVMGAGKWKVSYTAQLLESCVGEIIALPDNDEPGRKHVEMVASSCAAAGIAAKIVALPRLPPKGDASDWITAGGTREQLEAMVDAAPAVATGEPAGSAAVATTIAQPDGQGRPHCTDLGNAQRLAARHRDVLCYCYEWRRYLKWEGTHWRPDAGALAMRLAKETARSIYEEAAAEPDPEQRKKTAQWAMRSEGEARLKAMLELAKSEPGLPVEPADLDRDHWLLNVLNGTVDLRTGELRPHCPEDMITRLAPVAYDGSADCPRFRAFLHRIFDGNDAMIAYVQRIIGYSLVGDTSEQCFFVPYGTGANGKSTLLTTIYLMLGDYAASTRPETFMVKGADAIPNDIARLKGARLVVAIEAEEGRHFAESLIKQLTGGDVVTARFMRAEYFDFLPTFKVFLATNHKPVIRGTDRAIWRRLRVIPFTVTIPEAERDRELKDKLRPEWPGILRWAIEGCLAWQRDGLGDPAEVVEATESYRADMDVIGQFISDKCVLDPGAESGSAALYSSFAEWCKTTGEKAFSQKELGTRLADRGLKSDRVWVDGKRCRGWLGIRLRTTADADEPGEGSPLGHVGRDRTRVSGSLYESSSRIAETGNSCPDLSHLSQRDEPGPGRPGF